MNWLDAPFSGNSEQDEATVARVEALLAERAIEVDAPEADQARRPDHLIWLCACDSYSPRAPSWTLWDHPDGRLRWSRTDGAAPVAEPHAMAGDHVQPGQVLAWIEGLSDSPSSDDRIGDAVAVHSITALLRRAGEFRAV